MWKPEEYQIKTAYDKYIVISTFDTDREQFSISLQSTDIMYKCSQKIKKNHVTEELEFRFIVKSKQGFQKREERKYLSTQQTHSKC